MLSNFSTKYQFEDQLTIGCIETPERGSYYCKKHKSQKPVRFFRLHDTTIEVDVSNIKPRKGRFKESEVQLHDSFVDQDDRLLFLATYITEPKKIFWLTENQLSSAKQRDFRELMKNSLQNSQSGSRVFTLPCEKQARTVGIFVGMTNCGIIINYREIFKCESIQQATAFCLDTVKKCDDKFFNYVVYDDGCHLMKYIKNLSSDLFNPCTPRSLILQSSNYVVDRFHFKKHVDSVCEELCDANKYEELTGINTSIVEELNYWLSGYKHIFKHLNYE